MKNLYIRDHNKKSEQPINIRKIEEQYNGKFVGDFCIKLKAGSWSEIPLAIFYNPTPPNPEYSNYFGIGVDNDYVYITDGKTAFDDPIVGIIAKDGEVVFSRYRHDYVVSDDNTVFIDGGRDYTRSSNSLHGYVHLHMIDGQLTIVPIEDNEPEVEPTTHYTHTVLMDDFTIIRNDHIATIEYLLSKSETVIILVSNAYRARSCYKPFTYLETIDMISNVLQKDRDRIIMIPLQSLLYNPILNTTEILQAIGEITQSTNIAVYGKASNNFPQWDSIDSIQLEYYNDNWLLDRWHNQDPLIKKLIPEYVFSTITKYNTSLGIVKDEYAAINLYKESWKASPFPPTFMTSDAVVIQSGHILLVIRGDHPGKGLYALPGGFINSDEYAADAVIRELIEETQIDMIPWALKQCVVKSQLFDYPNRSARGRTFTHASLIILPNGPLLDVRGSDDAISASWIPLQTIPLYSFHEDHYDIITHMLGQQ